MRDDQKVDAGSIIELSENGWFVDMNPKYQVGIWYVRDNESPEHLYTYNNEYNIWTDVINKLYNVGYWRIGERKNLSL